MLRICRMSLLSGLLAISFVLPAMATSPFAQNLATRFTLEKIEVQDKYRNPPASISEALNRNVGQPVSLGNLRQIMREVREAYQQEGLGYVKVRLPLDEVQNGRVIFLVSAPGEPDPYGLKPVRSAATAKPMQERRASALPKAEEVDSFDVEEDDWMAEIDTDFDENPQEAVSEEDDILLNIPDESEITKSVVADEKQHTVLAAMRGEKKPEKELIKLIKETKLPQVEEVEKAPEQKPEPSIQTVALEGVSQVDENQALQKVEKAVLGQNFEMAQVLVLAQKALNELYMARDLESPQIHLDIDGLSEKKLVLKVREKKKKPVKPQPRKVQKDIKEKPVRARPPYIMGSDHKKTEEGIYILIDPQAHLLEENKEPEEIEEASQIEPKAPPQGELLMRMKALPAPPIVENEIEYLDEPSSEQYDFEEEDGSL